MPTRDKVLVERGLLASLVWYAEVAARGGRPGCEPSKRQALQEKIEKLRAALDSNQHEQVEEEYRVVAKYPHQEAVACCGATSDRNLAESIVRGTLDCREHIECCWLQTRTVTTLQDGTKVLSPWVDLDETGEES